MISFISDMHGAWKNSLKRIKKLFQLHIPILTYLARALRLEVLLDEPEEVLLVHAGGRVDVRVHLPHVVKVAVGDGLLRRQLPVFREGKYTAL